MKTHIILAALLPAFMFNLKAQSTFFDQADDFFHRHIQSGLIDYQAVEEDELFDQLIQQIANAQVSDWTDEEKKAFYINAYNLLTIKGVLDNYPIASVQDVAGFFLTGRGT